MKLIIKKNNAQHIENIIIIIFKFSLEIMNSLN